MSQHSSSPQESDVKVQAAKQEHQAACDECARHERRAIVNTLSSPALIAAGIIIFRELQQLSVEASNPWVTLGVALATGLTTAAGLISTLALPKNFKESNEASARAIRAYKKWLELVSQTYESKSHR
jgi:hypothetical protein